MAEGLKEVLGLGGGGGVKGSIRLGGSGEGVEGLRRY